MERSLTGASTYEDEEEKQQEEEQSSRIDNKTKRNISFNSSNNQSSEQQEDTETRALREKKEIEVKEASSSSAGLPTKADQKPPQPIDQQQAEQSSSQKLKSKITHRSQSSPSSLTTHKFGLRPTPSPPRLIIDHQTGDIVESYPEQPIYLRTYQPLDNSNDDTTNTNTLNDDSTLEDSIAHPYPPPWNNLRQLEQYNQLLAEHYAQTGGQANSNQPQFVLDDEELQAIMSHQQQQNNRSSFRPVIPPPHSASGKVYFAPPVSSVGHLFNHNQHHQNQQQRFNVDPTTINNHDQQFATTSAGNQLTEIDLTSSPLSGSHNNSFKRALNKLNDSSKTDIALVASENDDSSSTNRKGQGVNKMRITATSAAKANALLSAQQKQTNASTVGATSKRKLNHQHRVAPAIEDFNLYDLCYNFRILLVILLSSFIIYLLVVPLNLDCTSYRPTYTYISIIVASVNLICITIFTLFWYCNGVTRTLYANLSSSAFIITIYSILVAVNLALAVLFFFINTCHFHKLINTTKPTALALLRDTSDLDTLLTIGSNNKLLLANDNLVKLESSENENEKLFNNNLRRELESIERSYDDRSISAYEDKDNQQHSSSNSIETFSPRLVSSIHHNKQIKFKDELVRHRRSDDGNERDESEVKEGSSPDSLIVASQDHLPPPDGGNIMQHPHNHHHHHLHHDQAASPFAMSPIEAAWEYVKEQYVMFKRSFYRFLINYDLKFIGALHALCAICFQYMAMKVAVVRSYFCSPVRAYV